MGWWFGRIMTFEVIADSSPPTISSILADASAGAIASDDSQMVTGYAAYGASIAAAVQPLVDCFDLPLFDDGSTLRSPLDGAPIAIGSDELGNSADGQKVGRVTREQIPVRDVPSTLRLTYYDAQRDYQSGEARASAGDQSLNELQQELPAVLTADDAKTLVQQMLARQWSGRDRLTLRLPPAWIGIEPGSVVETGMTPSSWRAETCTIDGFVATLDLRPSWQPRSQLVGDAGRIVAETDVVASPTTFALIDVPNLTSPQATGPVLSIAAASPNGGWNARPLSVSVAGQALATQTAAAKSLLGRTSSVLANADSHLIDLANSVDVELIDPQQWMISCDDDALADGTNLAIIGNELVQFGRATALGNGRFRLSRLLRGRGGTEWATATHLPDELFCLLAGSSLRSVSIPPWARGSVISVADGNGSSASLNFAGESVRPLQPVNLSASFGTDGSLSLCWTRRSRNGFAWLDEVEAPVGESREQYLVTIIGAAADLEVSAGQASAIVAAGDLAPLGSGPATVEVRQVGDWAASRPTQLTINLP